MSISVIVPIKPNSRRLPNKNFLQLGNRPLSYHIFKTLIGISEISNVYCFTSYPYVLDLLPKGVKLLIRPEYLNSDDIGGNELFRYAIESIDDEFIIVCHATSPFISSKSIETGIDAVLNKGFDCSFSVCHSQKYSWYKGNPLNYNPTNMEQTQDIEPIYQETSGFYVFKRKDYLESNSRINGKPFMVTVDYKEAVDIDEPSDFSLASILINHNPAAFSQNGFSDTYFLDFFKEGMENKSIKHISFDLDGVLINSLNVMRQAWEYTMNAVNMSIPFDHYKDHIGIPFNDILNELNIDDSLHSTIFHEYNKISKINEKLIEVYNNTVDSIKLIKNNNIKVSVVTSKSLDRTESILRSKFNKISFDAVITPELVNPGRGKPSPDQLLYACHVVGVDPSYTLYVGDMDVDRMCAKKASCRFIYANWGYGDITSIKDVFFDSITDLTDYVISIR
jgi:CMP-N-acetylneuraminic acid synthetase/phosphoglycolate phosphatase-like HAD superfamily hydrolase